MIIILYVNNTLFKHYEARLNTYNRILIRKEPKPKQITARFLLIREAQTPGSKWRTNRVYKKPGHQI